VELDRQIKLGHLLLSERKCRICGETKNLLDSFYLIRKNRGALPSSYSYECKGCTIQRVIESRKSNNKWMYPDW